MTNPENTASRLAQDDLIVGLGQFHRGDDEVGLYIASQLKKLFPKAPITQLRGDLTDLLELWKGKRQVLIIDAIQTNERERGELFCLKLHEMEFQAEDLVTSTHNLPLQTVLELGKNLKRIPETLFFYGLEGNHFTQGASLDTFMKERADKLTHQIATEWLLPKVRTHL